MSTSVLVFGEPSFVQENSKFLQVYFNYQLINNSDVIGVGRHYEKLDLEQLSGVHTQGSFFRPLFSSSCLRSDESFKSKLVIEINQLAQVILQNVVEFTPSGSLSLQQSMIFTSRRISCGDEKDKAVAGILVKLATKCELFQLLTPLSHPVALDQFGMTDLSSSLPSINPTQPSISIISPSILVSLPSEPIINSDPINSLVFIKFHYQIFNVNTFQLLGEGYHDEQIELKEWSAIHEHIGIFASAMAISGFQLNPQKKSDLLLEINQLGYMILRNYTEFFPTRFVNDKGLEVYATRRVCKEGNWEQILVCLYTKLAIKCEVFLLMQLFDAFTAVSTSQIEIQESCPTDITVNTDYQTGITLVNDAPTSALVENSYPTEDSENKDHSSGISVLGYNFTES